MFQMFGQSKETDDAGSEIKDRDSTIHIPLLSMVPSWSKATYCHRLLINRPQHPTRDPSAAAWNELMDV
jgi:hypothetical protein